MCWYTTASALYIQICFPFGCLQVVNAFASQSDVEMKGKVIERLHDITHLMQVLAKCLAGESVAVVPNRWSGWLSS